MIVPRKLARSNNSRSLLATAVSLLLLVSVLLNIWQVIQARTSEMTRVATAKESEQLALQAIESERLARDAARKKQYAAEETEQQTANRLAQTEQRAETAEQELRNAIVIREFLRENFLERRTESERPAAVSTPTTPVKSATVDSVRELLDLAALRLAPDQIAESIGDLPLLQAEVLMLVGDAYCSDSEPAIASLLLHRALMLRIENAGLNHVSTQASRKSLGNAYRDAGKIDEALPLWEEILKFERATLGEDNPTTLTSMGNLALVYQDAGEASAAIKQLEAVVQLQTGKLGRDHADTLASLRHLAIANQDSTKFVKAVRIFEEIQDIHSKKLGPLHVTSMESKYDLALSYLESGRLFQALAGLEEVLAFRKQTFGDQDPRTIDNAHKLALAHLENEKPARSFVNSNAPHEENVWLLPQAKQARGRLEAMLKLSEAVNGAEHPSTIQYMQYLAQSYSAAGERELTTATFVDILRLQQRRLETAVNADGEKSPAAINALRELASTYLNMYEMEEALPLLKKIVELSEAKSGKASRPKIDDLRRLVEALISTGTQFDECTSLLKVALSRAEADLGSDHRATIQMKFLQSSSSRSVDEREMGAKRYEGLLTLSNETLGSAHPLTIAILEKLIDDAPYGLTESSWDASRKGMKDRHTRFVAKFGKEHPNTIVAQKDALIYETLLPRSDAEAAAIDVDAISNLVELEEQLRLKYGPTHPATLAILDKQVLLFQLNGQLHQALRVREKKHERLHANVTKDSELSWESAQAVQSMRELALANLEAGNTVAARSLIEKSAEAYPESFRVYWHEVEQAIDLTNAQRSAGNLKVALPLSDRNIGEAMKHFGGQFETTSECWKIRLLTYRDAGKLTPELIQATMPPESENEASAMLRWKYEKEPTSAEMMADEYLSTGKFDLALNLLSESSKLRESQYRESHPLVLASKLRLARAYQIAKKADLAIPLNEQLLQTLKDWPHQISEGPSRLGSPSGSDWLELYGMHNLAEKSVELVDSDLVAPLFSEILDRTKEKFGASHPYTFSAMRNLAHAQQLLGELPTSIALYEKLLTLQRNELGAEYPETIETMELLASANEQAHKVDLALEHFKQALVLRQKVNGPLHPRTLETMDGLAAAHLSANQFVEAESVCRATLVIREDQAPLLWQTSNTKSLLGSCLLGQRKYAEAKLALIAGFEGLKRQETRLFMQGKLQVLERAIMPLVAISEETNQDKEVAKWRAELAAVQATKVERHNRP